MSFLGDLITDTTADLTSELFGDFDAAAWSHCADVEGKQQASQPVTYTDAEGCVWHPDAPELKAGESRLRVVQSGTLLVPTSLDLTLSDTDRWKDADDVVWKPLTIGQVVHGFQHVRLTREERQFSGQTGKRGK